MISGNLRAQDRAQFIAAACFIVAVLGSTASAISGHEKSAIAIAAMDFASFSGIYIIGRRAQRKERDVSEL